MLKKKVSNCFSLSDEMFYWELPKKTFSSSVQTTAALVLVAKILGFVFRKKTFVRCENFRGNSEIQKL